MTATKTKAKQKVRRLLMQAVHPHGVFDNETLVLVPEGGIFVYVGTELPSEEIAVPAPEGAQAGDLIPLHEPDPNEAGKAPTWTSDGFVRAAMQKMGAQALQLQALELGEGRDERLEETKRRD